LAADGVPALFNSMVERSSWMRSMSAEEHVSKPVSFFAALDWTPVNPARRKSPSAV
jgi:hypothetical protein